MRRRGSSLGWTSVAAAAHGREDPEKLAEARGPVLQGAERAGPPRVPGSGKQSAGGARGSWNDPGALGRVPGARELEPVRELEQRQRRACRRWIRDGTEQSWAGLEPAAGLGLRQGGR